MLNLVNIMKYEINESLISYQEKGQWHEILEPTGR